MFGIFPSWDYFIVGDVDMQIHLQVWDWVWFHSTGGASSEEGPFVVRFNDEALFWRFHGMWKVGSDFTIIAQPRYGMVVGNLKRRCARSRYLVRIRRWIGDLYLWRLGLLRVMMGGFVQMHV